MTHEEESTSHNLTEHEGKKRIRPVIEEMPGSGSEEPAPVENQPEFLTPEPKEEHHALSSHHPGYSQPEPVPVGQPDLGGHQNYNDHKPKKGNFKLIFITAFITAIFVGLIAGGVYVYFSGTGNLSKGGIKSPVPTNFPLSSPGPTPPPEASPTPEPEPPDLAEYKVSILNGSGKIGEASKARTLLTEAGFKVSNVGNAKKFTYQETVIEAKTDVSKTTLNIIEKALDDNYVVEVSEDSLPASSTYDLIITVGSK